MAYTIIHPHVGESDYYSFAAQTVNNWTLAPTIWLENIILNGIHEGGLEIYRDTVL